MRGGTAHETCLFDLTLNGEEVQVEFRRISHWSYDAHYGADADGNRGIGMYELDDEEYEDVVVYFDDRGKVTLEDLEEPLRPLVVKAVEDYMEKHESEGEVEEPYDPREDEDPYERQLQREERERDHPDPID